MAHRRWRCSRRGSRAASGSVARRAGCLAVVPPADVPARAHSVGARGAGRPDDPARRALGRWPLPRLYRARRQPRVAPARFPDANVLAISRSGELALSIGAHLDGVVTYGTLARAPITGGTPRELVENVKFADWSPDGADLAIVRRVDGRDRLEYPIGTALVQPAAGENTGSGLRTGVARRSARGVRPATARPGSLFGRVFHHRSDRQGDTALGRIRQRPRSGLEG